MSFMQTVKVTRNKYVEPLRKLKLIMWSEKEFHGGHIAKSVIPDPHVVNVYALPHTI